MDIGKGHHHCVVIGPDGSKLLSRRVLNDEAVLPELISDVLALAEDVLWAVGINRGGAALLIGLLLAHGPGRHTAGGRRGRRLDKPYSPCTAVGATCCGPCSATVSATTTHHRSPRLGCRR
ncbi:IS110 family transposase [Actinoallomurus sp. NBC_01490]|uniref:IS110 family transposase n=1 Tax=Actinoallomurus sp. NBC_01490 TaxID=2903557 RepID=UPI003FA470A5